MYPTLFEIGPFTIHSFGLMMATAFLTATFIIRKELIRKKLNPDADGEILMASAIGGILGAKIYYLIENFQDLLRDPTGMIFSGAGLVWYGGFIGAVTFVILTIRWKKYPLSKISDAIAPGLALGYGIGRIGCFLAGDGDYGPQTDVPWGMAFPDGVVPTTQVVHPTPLYETIASVIVFGVLWYFRKKNWRDGALFWLYCILAGIERFTLEFWRINPRVALDLSMAQWFSIVLFIVGVIYFIRTNQQLPLPKKPLNEST